LLTTHSEKESPRNMASGTRVGSIFRYIFL